MSGDADGALSMYRDLQTDEPESPLLYYGQGCALHQQGKQESESPTPEHAIEAFKAARDAFEKASLSPDEGIRLKALYNRATSTAELATQLAKTSDSKAAVETFKDAIGQYEDLLKRRPDDQASKTNLDHLRYVLKKLLQNPPKQQEQKDQSGDKKDDKQQKSDQNKDQNQKNESQGADGEKKEQQGQQGQQNQEQKKDQQKEAQKPDDSGKDNKKDDTSSEQDKQQKLAEAKKNENQAQEKKDGKADESKSDRQSIDAILDSLEAQDNREQKDMMNQHGDIAMRRDWW